MKKILLIISMATLVLTLGTSVAKARELDQLDGDGERIDACSNLPGFQEQIPNGYVRYKATLCAKKYHSPPAQPQPELEPQVLGEATTPTPEAPLPQTGANTATLQSLLLGLALLLGAAGTFEILKFERKDKK